MENGEEPTTQHAHFEKRTVGIAEIKKNKLSLLFTGILRFLTCSCLRNLVYIISQYMRYHSFASWEDAYGIKLDKSREQPPLSDASRDCSIKRRTRHRTNDNRAFRKPA